VELIVIFVWSVHHTATWTTLKWLESHEDVRGVVEIRFLDKVLMDGSYNYMTVQKWGGNRTVLHDHFAHHKDGYQLDLRALALAMTHRTVIPMRDPLAVCLTAQHRTEIRGQGFDGLDAVKELRMLALAWPLVEAVVIPWDLAPGTSELRYKWLRIHSLGLALEDDGATFKWAQQWRVENTKGDYEYKRAYQQRDRRWIEKRLPEVWRELKKLEPLLRPKLEELGYKDLLWWG
jgi:hypothetical protein